MIFPRGFSKLPRLDISDSVAPSIFLPFSLTIDDGMELGCSGQRSSQLIHFRELTGLNSGVQESKLYDWLTFIRRKHKAHKQIRGRDEHKHEHGV